MRAAMRAICCIGVVAFCMIHIAFFFDLVGRVCESIVMCVCWWKVVRSIGEGWGG